MNFLKKQPIYLVLFPVFFCLHVVVENIGFVSFSDTYITGFYIFSSIIFLVGFLYLFNRSLQYSAIVIIFFMFWYCYFGAIKDFLTQYSTKIASYSIIVPLFIIVTFVIAFFFRKKIQLQLKWTFFINLLLATYCVVDICMLVFKKYNIENKQEAVLPLDLTTIKQKPNVYFLLFDEYAGYKTLFDSFSYRNDNFYTFLKSKNFVEIPSKSNYAMTPFCLSSTLNMKYIDGIKDTNAIKYQDIQNRYNEVRYATTFSMFEKMGYIIKNYSVFDVHDQKSLGTNPFVLGNNQLLVHKMLHNRFLKDLSHIFMFGKFKNNFFKKFKYAQDEKFNIAVENGLLNSLNTKNKNPQFVYSHF